MLLLKDLKFCHFLFVERTNDSGQKEYGDYLRGFSKLEQSKKIYNQAISKDKKIQKNYIKIGAHPENAANILAYFLYKKFISAIKQNKCFLYSYFFSLVKTSFELVKVFFKLFFSGRKVDDLPTDKNFDLVFGFPSNSFSYELSDDVCDSFANMWVRTNTNNKVLISIDEYNMHLDFIDKVLHVSQLDRIQTIKSYRIDFKVFKFFIPVCASILSFSLSRIIHMLLILDTYKVLFLIKKFNAKKSYFMFLSYPSGYCQCVNQEIDKIFFFSYSVNFFEIPCAWIYENDDPKLKNITPECWALSGNIIGNLDPITKIKSALPVFGDNFCASNYHKYRSFPLQLGYSSKLSFDSFLAQGNPVILVFNSRPIEDCVAKQSLLYGHPYLNIKCQINFIKDIIECAHTLGIFVVIKNKRIRRDMFDSFIIDLSKKYGNIFIEREYTRMSDLFSIASASLSFPFGTTKYVGDHFGVPSQYYVPEEIRCDGFGNSLTGVGELRKWLIDNVSRPLENTAIKDVLSRKL